MLSPIYHSVQLYHNLPLPRFRDHYRRGGRKIVPAKAVGGDYKDMVALIQEDSGIYEFTKVVTACTRPVQPQCVQNTAWNWGWEVDMKFHP